MRIQDAFFQCLRDKPVNKITVKEICELAEINRATFYTHYKDPFDLMEQLEQECLARIEKSIQGRKETGEGILLTILNGIQNPHNLTALLVSPHGDPGFMGKITALYHRNFAPSLAERLPGSNYEEQAEVYHFLAGGCGSLISMWMETEMRIPAEDMAKNIQRLCDSFVEIYKINGSAIT